MSGKSHVYILVRPDAAATHGFRMVVFTQPSKQLHWRYMRSTELSLLQDYWCDLYDQCDENVSDHNDEFSLLLCKICNFVMPTAPDYSLFFFINSWIFFGACSHHPHL